MSSLVRTRPTDRQFRYRCGQTFYNCYIYSMLRNRKVRLLVCVFVLIRNLSYNRWFGFWSVFLYIFLLLSYWQRRQTLYTLRNDNASVAIYQPPMVDITSDPDGTLVCFIMQ